MALTPNPSDTFNPTTPGDVAHQADHDQINPMLQPVLDAASGSMFRRVAGGLLEALATTALGRSLLNQPTTDAIQQTADVDSRAQVTAKANSAANAARIAAIASANAYTDQEVEAAVKAGAVNPRGYWDAEVTYDTLDLVSHAGNSWYASEPISAGVEPGALPVGQDPWISYAGGVDEATVNAGLALRVRKINLPVNPLSSPYADSVIVDGLVHPLSEGYTTLEDAQAAYPHVTSLTQTFDWAVIQQAINDGRAVDLPEVDVEAGHRYLVNGPLLLKDHAQLIGRGPGAWLHNVRDDATANAGAVVTLHAGLFHPGAWVHNGGTMNQDPVDAISFGDTSVTLSNTPSQTLVVGQVVLVFDETPGLPGLVGNGMINKIIAITGSSNEVIHLEYPLTRTWTSPCYISDGRGHQQGGYTALDTTYESYLTEGVLVEKMTISSAVNNWLNRTAVLRGRFRNLHIQRSLALIYGNAYGDCSFENITGVYDREFSEIAQCGHSNRATNITARSRPGAPPTSQVAIRMGLGGVLAGFEIVCGIDRDVRFVSAQERQQIRDGTIRLKGANAVIAHFNGTRDSVLENVNVHWDNALTGTAIIMGDSSRPTVRGTIRDVRLFAPTADTFAMLQLRDTVTDALIEGLWAPGGIVSSSGATLTGRMDRSRIHGLDTATWIAHAKNLVGAGNVFSEWAELERLRRDSAAGLTITSTTPENVAYTRTLGATQKVRKDNILGFTAFVTKTGTAASQRVKLVLSDLTVADLTLPAAKTGMFRLDGGITSEAGSGITRLHWWTLTHPDGVTERAAVFTGGATEPFPATASLELRAWKLDASDVMVVRRFAFLPDFALA